MDYQKGRGAQIKPENKFLRQHLSESNPEGIDDFQKQNIKSADAQNDAAMPPPITTFDENGNEKIGHHIRMKGMPSQIIKNYNQNVMQTYLDLFNGKAT